MSNHLLVNYNLHVADLSYKINEPCFIAWDATCDLDFWTTKIVSFLDMECIHTKFYFVLKYEGSEIICSKCAFVVIKPIFGCLDYFGRHYSYSENSESYMIRSAFTSAITIFSVVEKSIARFLTILYSSRKSYEVDMQVTNIDIYEFWFRTIRTSISTHVCVPVFRLVCMLIVNTQIRVHSCSETISAFILCRSALHMKIAGLINLVQFMSALLM